MQAGSELSLALLHEADEVIWVVMLSAQPQPSFLSCISALCFTELLFLLPGEQLWLWPSRNAAMQPGGAVPVSQLCSSCISSTRNVCQHRTKHTPHKSCLSFSWGCWRRRWISSSFASACCVSPQHLTAQKAESGHDLTGSCCAGSVWSSSNTNSMLGSTRKSFSH